MFKRDKDELLKSWKICTSIRITTLRKNKWDFTTPPTFVQNINELKYSTYYKLNSDSGLLWQGCVEGQS